MVASRSFAVQKVRHVLIHSNPVSHIVGSTIVSYLRAGSRWLERVRRWVADWRGEAVFARRQDLPLKHRKQVVGSFSYNAEVLRDRGGWIEVRHNEKTNGRLVGMVKKSDVVLAANAVDFFSDVVRLDPDSSWGWKNRAIAHYMWGELLRAMSDLDNAIRLNPDAPTLCFRGILKYEVNDLPAAVADFDEAIHHDHSYTLAFARRGWTKCEQGDLAGAIADYDEVIRMNPRDSGILVDRGQVKYGLQDYVGAIADYDEAIRVNPGNASYYFNRGLVRGDLEDFAGAIEDYSATIRLDPQYTSAYSSRGWTRSEQNDLAGAIKDYDEAIRLDPNDPDLYKCRGWIKSEQKNCQGAIADYDEAIRLDPHDAWAFMSRGRSKLVLKEYVGAIHDFDEAIRLDPNLANAYYLRGFTRYRVRDYCGSIKDFEKTLDLDPERAYVHADLAFLFATATDISVRDTKRALLESGKALDASPEGGHALTARACALAATEKYVEAISLQGRALESADYAADDDIYGGKHAPDRIAAWLSGKQWLQP